MVKPFLEAQDAITLDFRRSSRPGVGHDNVPRAVQWKMQIDGRVPDAAGNDEMPGRCAWQGNTAARIPPRNACYKVSITLRIMRRNDTLN